MAQPNGRAPQHHLTAKEIVAKALERRSERWHWDALDLDLLIRPRTTAENAAVVDESTRLTRDAEAYEGTADAPGSIEGYRLRLRASIPCIFHPDDHTPVFGIEDVDDLLELDTPALNALLEKVDQVSNFTQTQAEEAAKNSVETDGGSTSSVSPSAAETPGSSPTPMP